MISNYISELRTMLDALKDTFNITVTYFTVTYSSNATYCKCFFDSKVSLSIDIKENDKPSPHAVYHVSSSYSLFKIEFFTVTPLYYYILNEYFSYLERSKYEI